MEMIDTLAVALSFIILLAVLFYSCKNDPFGDGRR